MKVAALVLAVLVAGASAFLALGPRNFVHGFNEGYAATTRSEPTGLILQVYGPRAGRTASVTIGVDGQEVQNANAVLPFTYRLPRWAPDGNPVVIESQDNSGKPGDLSCVIQEGDQIVQHDTSHGPYSTVTCTAS